MDFWSDDYISSSESEPDEEEDEIYCPRQLDYWALEEFMDFAPPPPVLTYLENVSLVTIRDCIVKPDDRLDIYDIVPLSCANNWQAFWSEGRENPHCKLTFEDFDVIGEYCMRLCKECGVYDMWQVRICMKRILRLGRF